MTVDIDFVVIYGGEWENCRGMHTFKGGRSLGVIVSNAITYEEFVKLIYQLIEVDFNSSDLVMKFVYNTHFKMDPMELKNERDLQFFLRQNDHPVKPGTPLCVTTKQRASDPFISQDASFVPMMHREFVSPIVGSVSVSHEFRQCTSKFAPHEVGDDQRNNNNNYSDFQFSDYISLDNVENDVDQGNEDDYDGGEWENLVDDGKQQPHDQATCDVGDNRINCSNSVGPSGIVASNSISSSSGVGVTVGQIYMDKKQLQKDIAVYAMKENRMFRVLKSTKTLYAVKCVDSGCDWRLRAMKMKDSDLFKVTRFNSKHECSLNLINQSHRQASGKVIGECIKSKYEGVGRSYRPKDIVSDVRAEFGVNISYDKAWRAREFALETVRGSPELSFSYLPHYCSVLEQNNPGTVTHIESDNDDKFKYFFLALGPSLRGFRSSMRRVIAVDGTHLKGKYMGTLFVAAALDGNKNIYPVAFGIGDSENNASWEWFMGKVRSSIDLDDYTELAIISDRHKSIERAVALVFPESYHGHCIHHIKQNMRAKKIDDGVFPIYFKAAKVYRSSEFEHLMVQLRGFDDGRAHRYLVDAGFDKWARAHFPGRRYSIMTTNIAESLNAVLREARCLPITKLVDHLRALIQRWFHERRTSAASTTSILCKKIDKKLRRRVDKAQRMSVEPISHIQFYVRDGCGDGEVNLHNRTCTCMKFEKQQLPCVHALAACRIRNIEAESMCSRYYSNEAIMVAYAEPIYTVPVEDHRMTSDNRRLLPPDTRRPGGRPKQRRIPSAGEAVANRRCGRCKKIGHNRQTCKEPVAATGRV